MKKIVPIILACLLAGGGLAYFASCLIYTPILEDYVEQINNQNNEISRLVWINCNLEQAVTEQESLLSSQQTEIETLTAEIGTQKQVITDRDSRITSLKLEKNSLQEQLGNAEAEIEDLEVDLLSKQKEILDIKKKLDNVLDIEVLQYYEWTYSGVWQWNIPIPLSSYVEYSERPRPTYAEQFVDMAIESKDDPCIRYLANEINTVAEKRGFSDKRIVNFVAVFVQSMPYTVDWETKSRDEYPRYPVETLFDRGGDCEDTSILVATLLDSLGIDVVLLELIDENHMAVGVNVPVSYGTYYEYGGEEYFYLETTSDGWKVGQFPPDFSDGRVYIYPLRG